MRKHAPYIVALLKKHRAMTVTQLGLACEGMFGRTVLYRNLRFLRKLNLIQRVSHPDLPIYGYIARPELDQVFGRSKEEPIRMVRVTDLPHAFAVTDALLELSRYSFVTAIGHESELSPNDERMFCPGRRPDGIIQIERESWKYEIAVEVETSAQNHARIQQVFELYRDAISDPNYHCAGVVFVLHPRCDPEIYQEERMKLPTESQGRILIQTQEGLARLYPLSFGDRSARCGFECASKCEKVRQVSTVGVQYLPMILRNADFQLAHIDP